MISKLAWRAHPWGVVGCVLEVLSGLFPALIAYCVARVVAAIANHETPVSYVFALTAFIALEQLWGAAATTARLSVVDAVTKAADEQLIASFAGIETIEALADRCSPEYAAVMEDIRGAIGRSLNTWVVSAMNITYIAGLLVTAITFSPWLLLAALATMPHVFLGGWAHNRIERVRAETAPALSTTSTLIDEIIQPSAAREVYLAGTSHCYANWVKESTAHWIEPRDTAEKYAVFWDMVGRLITAVGLGIAVFMTVKTAGDRIPEVLAAMAVIIVYITTISSTAHATVGMLAGTWKRVKAWREMMNYPKPLPRQLPDAPQRVERLTYRYPGAQEDALKEISLQLHPNETVAIVGPNGAGKSTLAAVLLGVRNGAESVPRNRTMVAQNPLRIPGTLLQSVGMSQLGTVNEHTLKQVCARVDVPSWEYIEDASGGQWQRISIARALLPAADTAILDEPTSALDAEAAEKISQIFFGMAEITVIVTHRLSTARKADRILVVEDGRIVADGNHEMLLGQDGWYSQMFHAQAGGYQ